MNTPLTELAPDLWLASWPLKMLGFDLRRNVTVIRLPSGRLIIHSTAPFSPAEADAIRALGEPAWLVDTLLRHDTFAREGRETFPAAAYLAPAGFPGARPLIPAPEEWSGTVEVLSIDGAPSFGEVVMLHRPSRTLIVADLVFNFSGPRNFWERFLLGAATVGGAHAPGFSRPFKKAVTDPAAFTASLRTLLAWDFDRVVVGHGAMIPSGGKEGVREALARAGFDV